MFFIVPRGPKAIPFIMLVVGVIGLLINILDFVTIKAQNDPDNVFYSISDDYDKVGTDVKFFVIEDLSPIQIHSRANHGMDIYCLSSFKDGTGTAHFLLLDIPFKSDLYDELSECTNDNYTIRNLSVSGVFSQFSQTNTDITYYIDVFQENPLKNEKYTRTLKLEEGVDDYQSFLENNYKTVMAKQIALIVLFLALVVFGVILWRKLSARRY